MAMKSTSVEEGPRGRKRDECGDEMKWGAEKQWQQGEMEAKMK